MMDPACGTQNLLEQGNMFLWRDIYPQPSAILERLTFPVSGGCVLFRTNDCI